MKRVNTILSVSALALALSLSSWAQEVKQLPTQTVTISGTVATIDHAKRVVNIKTSDGKFETIDVPAGAKRFDELKVGDKVSLTYNNNVSARLKPAGEAPVDTGSSTTTAGQQTRPGRHGNCAENDDRDRRRDRQERIFDDLLWSERLEIQSAYRRSDCVRQGQGWRQGRHHLEHRRHGCGAVTPRGARREGRPARARRPSFP